MRNKVIKIVILVIIIAFIISSFYISNAGAYNVSQFSGSAPTDTKGVTGIRTIIGMILDIVRIAGAGIAIIMVTILAGKYMMASVGEKAEIKKHATTYVIGAIVMISAAGILGIVRDFIVNNLN